MTQTTINQSAALVPLADCYLHPLNTRSEPPAEDIDALAQSIESIGLLQNLSGWEDPARPDEIGIVAGGRRLRAFWRLAERDDIDQGLTQIPVLLAPDEVTARLWASAENEAREPLHPADEVRAYARMSDAGSDPNAIARAFAVTERHVKGRLKLAALPEPALDALREGQISLDQASALTAGNSDAEIEAQVKRVLESHWPIGADEIRRKFRQGGVSLDDKRVKLVGLDAYRDAGGSVNEDLFTDHVEIRDIALLDELVEQRLLDAAEFNKIRGWKWVGIADRDERYELSKGMQRIYRTPVELPEADGQELDELTEADFERVLQPEEQRRLDELQARAEGDFDDEDIPRSGIWIYLDYDGEIEIHGPFRDPDEKADDGNDTEAPGPQKTETRALPQNLRDDLARIRLASLQIRAARQPELMLDLLAWQMSGEMSPWSKTLEVTHSAQPVVPDKADGFEAPSLFDTAPDGRGECAPEAFAAFREKGKKHRNEILTRALARALKDHQAIGPMLAAQLTPNPREFWTPTKVGYFTRLPAATLDAIWADLVPADRFDPAEFAKLKKGEKAAQLDKLFNSDDHREALGLSREMNARIDAWLPAELQWPELEGET